MKNFAQTLEAKVLRSIEEHSLVSAGETVLAAVSGGADSTALLLLLHSLKESLCIRVIAAHFEHGIRGEESKGDQRFVQELCQKLEIPCVCGHGDVPALSRIWRCGMEDAARRARYAFLEEEAEKAGAEKIALAHQMEDQAETLLLHLTHGCGLDGLCGMRFQMGRRIRPLLECSRGELEEYVKARGETWREDSSNRECAYTRNRLRNTVFPQLKTINPQVIEAFCRTAQQAQRAAEILQAQAEEALFEKAVFAPFGVFLKEDTMEKESPLRREALRLLARRAGVPELSMEQTLRLENLKSGEKCNLPGEWRAQRSPKGLYLMSPKPNASQDVLGKISAAEPFEGMGDGVLKQCMPKDVFEDAVLRFAQEGDRFHPLGSVGEQKLTEAMRDAGIESPFRPFVPVLAHGRQVLWMIGTGKISQEAAVGERESEKVYLRYTGRLIWKE